MKADTLEGGRLCLRPSPAINGSASHGHHFHTHQSSPSIVGRFSDADAFVNTILAELAGLYDDCCCAVEFELIYQHEEAIVSR
jgi:hypothetical protein